MFDGVGKRRVVNADVLDAWFPPAPGVRQALVENADWILHTSPPTYAEGLVQAVSERYGIPSESLMVGSGSSDLIFSALRVWLRPGSRMLLVEPSYGEYAHLARLIGCEVDNFTLSPLNDFHFDLNRWREQAETGRYDIVVLVNPNNPTSGVLSSEVLEKAISSLPSETRVLVDEAYLDYTSEHSLGPAAASSNNLFVVKSLSKGLALSGLRVAYLVGPRDEIAALRRWSPPWHVSLPAQLAAIRALEDPTYYEARYAETTLLRRQLASDLRLLGLQVWEGAGNWVLCQLNPSFQGAEALVAAGAAQGIYIRNAGRTAPSLGDGFIRIATKPRPDQKAVLRFLEDAREHASVGSA